MARVGIWISTFRCVYGVDFEYASQNDDELDLQVGDIIATVNSEEDEGWNRGILNGAIGVFPTNVCIFY